MTTTSDNKDKKPRIIIPRGIMNRLQAYIDLCDKEISGLGTVVYDSNHNGYLVKRIMLLEQEVSSTTTDLDDNAVAQALYEYREYEGKEEIAFWWHSHVNMTAFWSGTDHETMDSIGKNGLCVALVLNKRREKRGAIVMKPKNFPLIKFDDVEILIQDTIDFKMDDLKAEIAQKVKEKVYKSYTSPYSADYDWKKSWQKEEGTTTKAVTVPESGENERQLTLLGGNKPSPTDTYRKNFREKCQKEWDVYSPSFKEAYGGDFEEYYQDQLREDLSLGYGNSSRYDGYI